MPRKVNPWAVCHAQLGKKKTDKFERCVMKVKSKQEIKEKLEVIRVALSLLESKKSTDDAIADFLGPQPGERGPKLTGKDLKKGRDPKTGKVVASVKGRGYELPLKDKLKEARWSAGGFSKAAATMSTANIKADNTPEAKERHKSAEARWKKEAEHKKAGQEAARKRAAEKATNEADITECGQDCMMANIQRTTKIKKELAKQREYDSKFKSKSKPETTNEAGEKYSKQTSIDKKKPQKRGSEAEARVDTSRPVRTHRGGAFGNELSRLLKKKRADEDYESEFKKFYDPKNPKNIEAQKEKKRKEQVKKAVSAFPSIRKPSNGNN